MDASRLAFCERSIDFSVISLALHHMLEGFQLSVLCELARVPRYKVIIVEPNAPRQRRWASLWGKVFSLLDESDYMHEWARQDFAATCYTAKLHVEAEYVLTIGLHRAIVCRPMR
jgi:ubiquinone/menaquinone biosynthesis C-methylase UbiE